MVFCDSVFSPQKLRSGVLTVFFDTDACKASGKDIFADFPHSACCLNCYTCTKQGLSLPTSLIIITHS